MRDQLTFTRLLPSRELSSTQLEQFLAQLATAHAPRPLVFETWASDDGIKHFVGRTEAGRGTLRTLIRSHLPGSRMLRASRPESPEHIARLHVSPRSVPLRDDALEATLLALYGVLAGRRKGEVLAIQIALGVARRPAQVPAKIPDPAADLLTLIIRGVLPAPAETRSRIAKHAAQARLEATVRIGVSAAAPERRGQLRGQFASAFSQLEGPGVRLTLANESQSRWEYSPAGRSGIPLTSAQLAGLMAWPVDDLELPGLPPKHPRLLPPSVKYSARESVFAEATAPGISHQIGLSPEDRLQHLAITGGTGSGKSQVLAALALSDIEAGRPLVLIEPKRQLVDYIVTRAPKEAAGRVIVIDAAESNPVGFNPLDIGDREPGPVVDGILEVFKAVFDDGWGPRTEDILHAGLLTLVSDGQQRGRPHTLLDLPTLLSDDGYRRATIGAVAGDPTLAGFWATFDQLSPANRASIVAAPLNKLRKYVLRKNVAAVLGQAQPRFRLRDVFRRGDVAVLVPLNDALIGPGAAQLLGGLVVAEVWLATQERALETDPQSRPGMVYIDEVQRYLHLPTSIDDALATSRSYGVGWHLALQGRSQVPTSMALALELNARNQITFAASPNDAAALAKTTTKLVREDFQSLERFHIYANLVINGAPAGWFSAKTLPPAAASGHGALIRSSYRKRFGGDAMPAVSKPAEPTVAAPVNPAARTNQRRRRS